MQTPSSSHNRRRNDLLCALAAVSCCILVASGLLFGPSEAQELPTTAEKAAYPLPAEVSGEDLLKQSKDIAEAKSNGCILCHQNSHDPHWDGKLDQKQSFYLGCVDCHGGDPSAAVDARRPRPAALSRGLAARPANPVRSYTLLNHESPEFIRFVNPGDLRIAHLSCGTMGCHARKCCKTA